MNATDRPNPTTRRVVVEYDAEDGYVAMDETGDVHFFATPVQVVHWVKKVDTKAGFAVTAIEWRNTPPGFTAPVSA